MFVVLLRFSENKSKASEHMQGHKAWIQKGFDDRVFLITGGLQPNMGGAVLAHNLSLQDLQQRVSEDPFVAENIVRAEILEITPSKVEDRLGFLMPH